jgi:hypothetical protein
MERQKLWIRRGRIKEYEGKAHRRRNRGRRKV